MVSLTRLSEYLRLPCMPTGCQATAVYINNAVSMLPMHAACYYLHGTQVSARICKQPGTGPPSKQAVAAIALSCMLGWNSSGGGMIRSDKPLKCHMAA